MKTIKALALVIFLVAIFLCVRVFLNEPPPRMIHVSQPARSEKVADRTGTGGGVKNVSVSALTCYMCAPLWYVRTCVHRYWGDAPNYVRVSLSETTFSPSYACTAVQQQSQQVASKTRMKVRCTPCMLLHRYGWHYHRFQTMQPLPCDLDYLWQYIHTCVVRCLHYRHCSNAPHTELGVHAWSHLAASAFLCVAEEVLTGYLWQNAWPLLISTQGSATGFV